MPLLTAAGYGLPFVELVLGMLLTIGLFTRAALVGGLIVMIALTFGVCLAQNWPVASEQLIYLLVYAVLLAALRYEKFSLDRAIFGGRNS